MANYNESNINGVSWQRAKSILIRNEYGKTPEVIVEKEKLIHSDGDVIAAPVRGIRFTFSDITETFPLVDPLNDDAPLGSEGNAGMLQVMLHSFILHKMKQEDEKEEASVINHHLELGRGLEEQPNVEEETP